jgi:hypothetical protein
LGIAARETFVDEISDRTNAIISVRQNSDPVFVLIGRVRVIRSEDVEINRRVQKRDQHQLHDGDHD